MIDFLGISNTASTHAAFPRIVSDVCGIYEFRSPSPCLPLIVDNVIPNGVIFLFRSALHTNCCIILSYGEPEPLGSCTVLGRWYRRLRFRRKIDDHSYEHDTG